MDEPCVYKRISRSAITFLVLYVIDILLIVKDVGVMSSVKIWLSSHFAMNYLGDAFYILGIKLFRNRNKRIIGLSQANYTDNRLASFFACTIPKRDLYRFGKKFISQKKCVLKPKNIERK